MGMKALIVQAYSIHLLVLRGSNLYLINRQSLFLTLIDWPAEEVLELLEHDERICTEIDAVVFPHKRKTI